MIPKKRILFIILIVVVVIALTSGCIILLQPADTAKMSGVELSVDPESVSPTGLTFTITNSKAGMIEYSPRFHIEKKGLFGWRKLAELPLSVPAVEYIVTANSSRNIDFDWTQRYGRLYRGTYRVVVQVKNMYLAAEFTIF